MVGGPFSGQSKTSKNDPADERECKFDLIISTQRVLQIDADIYVVKTLCTFSHEI